MSTKEPTTATSARASKTVYQCDEGGTFVAETIAHESPLEPGVYHLPGGCVERAPPTLAEGERARWLGDDWVIVAPDPEPIPKPPTKDELRARARMRRMEVEAQGVTVDGVVYATDLESQARMALALTYMDMTGQTSKTWKSRSGYVVLTIEMLQAATLTVGAHVQACFDAQATVLSRIDHGDFTTLADVDEATCWPTDSGGV